MDFSLKGSAHRHIYDDLYYNLNRWPRVEAGRKKKYGGPTRTNDADEHFYDKCLPNDVLDALTEATGEIYAHWGTVANERCVGGFVDVDLRNGGFYVPVGLRWTESLESWETKSKNAAAKQIRHNDPKDNLWKPQIVCMIRPLEVFLMFKRKCSDSKGKLIQGKVDQTKDWQQKLKNVGRGIFDKPFEIIPLKFELMMVGRAARAGSFTSNGLYAEPSSRHFSDDDKHVLSEDTFRADATMLRQLVDAGHECYQRIRSL